MEKTWTWNSKYMSEAETDTEWSEISEWVNPGEFEENVNNGLEVNKELVQQWRSEKWRSESIDK